MAMHIPKGMKKKQRATVNVIGLRYLWVRDLSMPPRICAIAWIQHLRAKNISCEKGNHKP